MNKIVVMLVTNSCISDPRVQFEAETLTEKGFEVHIIAWDRQNEGESISFQNGYTIHRIKNPSRYGSGIKQLGALIQFFRLARKTIKQRITKPEIIHCNDMDTLPLGLYYKLFKNKKLVYDAHELYSEMAFQNHKFVRKTVNFLEKIMIRKVDIFFTVGVVRKEWYEKEKYPRIPIILGNWKETVDIGNVVDKVNVASKFNDKVIITYIGALGPERNLELLLEAVTHDDRFACIIAGAGKQKDLVTHYAASCNRIEYLGYLSDHKLIAYYTAISDVLYYGLYSKYLVSQTTVPNKLYEAIAYKKVFLTSKLGEIKLIDKNSDLFFYATDNQIDLDALYHFLKDEEKLQEYRMKLKLLANQYSRSAAKQLLVRTYEELYHDELYTSIGTASYTG